MSKVVVIGGGAAGLMAAGTAGKYNNDVVLIEKNNNLGEKLKITGKGKCNLTNITDINNFIDKVPTNGKFLYSAFYSFTNHQLINLINKLGVRTKVERGGRVFPVSNDSQDIINAFKKYMMKHNVKVITGEKVVEINTKHNKVSHVILEHGKNIDCESVIIATGGLSYPETGSTGDGFKFAKNMGHTVMKPHPALVPLELEENWVKKTQNLTLKNISISIFKNGNLNSIVYTDFGELTFTDYGVKGPVILSASSHLKNIKNNNYTLSIDLKPALSFKKLDHRIQRDFKKYSKKYFGNALDDLLPIKLIPIIIELSTIPYQKPVHQITKEERTDLIKLLKNLTLNIKDTRPIKEAIITSGGISINEIDPGTMASKIISNLFFAGEIINVDGYTGGYNLQIAFSTGYLAGIEA